MADALRGFSVPVVMMASLAFLSVASPYAVEASWILIIPVQLVLNRVLRSQKRRT